MARPSYDQSYRAVVGKLRINPKVMRTSVPQLTFSPSIGVIARDIDKLGLNIKSFREPLKRAVQQVIIPSIQRNFDAEGRPSWEPYSEGTIEIRDNLGSPVGNLLYKRGYLKRTMSYLNIWTINNNAAILLDLPPSVWYGKLQQGGFEGSGSLRSAARSGKSVSGALRTAMRNAQQARTAGTTVKAGARPIPARPFIMLQPKDEDDIVEVFIKWLEERIERDWAGRHV